MKTRNLGWTGEPLTVIGLGTWAMGGGDWSYGWGPQDDQESIRTIERALDLGINWIDTAPVYGLGHAEEIVGRAIQGKRDQVFLATKCGLVWDDQKRITGNLSRESIRKEVEASLKRLRTDVIDLYQIHWPNPEAQIEEAWEAMSRLVEEGKVRYIGVSNFSVAQMDRVREIHPIASLQPPYHLFDRGIEREILPYCARHQIGVIVYSPLASGLLTGKYDRQRIQNLPANDWRRRSPLFTEPAVTVNLWAVDALKEVASDLGVTLAQLAIAWTLRRSEVTAAIVGARKPHQIEETVKAAEIEIPQDALTRIEEILAERARRLAKAG